MTVEAHQVDRMGFQFTPERSAPWLYAIDPDRQISVYWEAGLGRRPERGERGGTWRFTHTDWSFSILIEGEEWDSEWVLNAPGTDPAGFVKYGPDASMKLWTFSDPRKTMRGLVSDDITSIIAEAMLAIYSSGGKYPGVIEFRGPRGLKRSYRPKQ